MAALRDFLVLTHSVLTSDAAKHLGVKLAILHKSQEVLVPVEFWSDLVVDFPGHLCIVRQLLITQKKQKPARRALDVSSDVITSPAVSRIWLNSGIDQVVVVLNLLCSEDGSCSS